MRVSEDLFKKLVMAFEAASPPDREVRILPSILCGACNEFSRTQSSGDFEILECVTCSVRVHRGCCVNHRRSCAAGQGWRCPKCSKAPQATCVFCPDSMGYLVPTTEERWVHMLCALWIPEVVIDPTNQLVPVDVSKVPAARSSLVCTFFFRLPAGHACELCCKVLDPALFSRGPRPHCRPPCLLRLPCPF
eukprot:m.143902 g.143902  ORF g.143902 m.143902 type:complete len:191 (-) comp14999_c1_seq2:603-1175(-)